MSITPEMEETNKAVKKMLWLLVLALIPLFITFVIYLINPYSETFNFIARSAINLPAVMSANSPLLSKVMDVYVKTAPVFAFLAFLMTHKKLNFKHNRSIGYTLKIYLYFTIFYAIMIYAFLFSDTELTEKTKLLKLASMNDVFMLILYVILYSATYMFGYLYLWFTIGIYREIKERR